MRAQNNSLSKDSVHVQFSDSVDSVGTAIMRIGSTNSAEVVLQNGPSGAADHGWGWGDNGWGSLGVNIRFAADGAHTIRVQQREDGAIIDQIVLSPDTYVATPPGPRQDDATILPNTDGSGPPPPPPPPPTSNTVVLWVSPSSTLHGNWQVLSDTTAAGNSAVWNPDAGAAKIAPALGSPTNYLETTFTADASTAYHVWVRMRAQGDSLSNDSVHIQYSDSVDSTGTAIARIGTTASTEYVLQNGPNGPADQGWGWTDNGWGALGSNIYFATSGTHTLRVQQREDGAIIDQIVISPDTYLNTAPGARQNDATILPSTGSSSPPPPPPCRGGRARRGHTLRRSRIQSSAPHSSPARAFINIDSPIAIAAPDRIQLTYPPTPSIPSSACFLRYRGRLRPTRSSSKLPWRPPR
jgi:hypothetical protein